MVLVKGAPTRHSFGEWKNQYLVTLALVYLHETGGRELKHQYLHLKIDIFWSRWLKPSLALPKPSLAQAQPGARFLEIWGPGNPEISNPKNQK